MHNLIYLSSASFLFDQENLKDILNKSRINNASNNITGILLYHEGSILQILEGEKPILERVFKRISLDDRHKGIIQMVDTVIEKRNFEGWLMGFKQLSADDWSKLAGHFDLNNKDLFKNISKGTNHAINLIKSFGQVNKLT